MPLFLHSSITWTLCCIKPRRHWQKGCRTFKTMQQELWRNRKSCHITPLLFDLHWLTVEYWSQYKILLLVYKSLHGKSPAHLASMLEKHSPIRFLCSAIQLRLYESWVKKRYGDRALSVVGPSLLNNLDPYIKQSSSVTVFKTRLKTYLFEKAFKASKI